MPNTDQDVADRAIRDLGADYSQYNFADDPSFQAYVLDVADDVTADHSARVNPYSLDNPHLFSAAALETESRMVYRILNMFYQNVLSTESITIGPISLMQGRNESVSKDIQGWADTLHDQAEAELVAGGAKGRSGAIRVWIPNERIVII
jgi:hypothetical protein